MQAGGEEGDALSRAEVAAAVGTLTVVGWAKIQRAAAYLTWNEADAADLRQEAICRTLEGTRTCPRSMPVEVTIIGIMRSLRSADAKARSRQPELVSEALGGEQLFGASDVPDPEQSFAEQQAGEVLAHSILSVFNDDPTAQAVVEGIMLGFEGKELCELVEITSEELATKRRLIRRRLAQTSLSRRG